MKSFVWALIIISVIIFFVLVSSQLLLEEAKFLLDGVASISEDEDLYATSDNRDHVKNVFERIQKKKNFYLLILSKEKVYLISDQIFLLDFCIKQKDFRQYLILKMQLQDNIEELMEELKLCLPKII